MASLKVNEYRAKVILGWTTLHFAEETESWESVEALLNGGASTRDLFTTKRKLKNPLQAPLVVKEICRRGCLKLLRFALSENPELVNTKLDMGRILLHVAAQSGSSVAVRCLLDYPVDLNASDGRGVTPLHEAAAHCDAYILRQLLKQGANVQARDIDGRTALHYAASGGSASGIQVLLEAGLSPDVESINGCSPLHEAASSLNHHCVQMLLNAGADLHMTTNAGWTALHWAAMHGTARSLRLLLEAGIEPGVRTQEDETPLHFAAVRGDSDMVTILVDAGADIEAKDSAGRTPAKRASDYIQKQEEEAAAEMAEKAKQRKHREVGKSPAPVSEKRPAELRPNTPSSVQGDDGQTYDGQTYADDAEGDVEGSEYSFRSESEISGQVYSDNGSDFEEENYSAETASGGAPAYNKPPSLLSLDTNPVQCDNKVRGHPQRGKYRGRGRGNFRGNLRGNFRGHRSGSRGGGHVQPQEGKPEHHREYTQAQGKTYHTGNVQQGEHRHHRRQRRHKAKEGEAEVENNTQSNSGDPSRNENFTYVSGENTRMKHPFSKDRQKHPSDERHMAQNFVPNPEKKNLQRREAFGSSDQVNRSKTDQPIRSEIRSGGTFLDELRYLQEKLAAVNAATNQSQSSVPSSNPKLPPKPQL